VSQDRQAVSQSLRLVRSKRLAEVLLLTLPSQSLCDSVLGEGAVWIWNLADLHFTGAIQIVDLYHARQHLSDLAAELFPKFVCPEALGHAAKRIIPANA